VESFSRHRRLVVTLREHKIGPETYTLSGHSIFYKNPKGEIFRTYGAFGRGDEQFMAIFGFFDVLPKGPRGVWAVSLTSGLGKGS
jgi:predicted dithiol-disulfide oxidoreductase (DUF899 family)